jgi:O-methyltransferase
VQPLGSELFRTQLKLVKDMLPGANLLKRQVQSVVRRLVGEQRSAFSALAPETRAAHRRMRMIFPPAFPERTAGLFAILRYLVQDSVPGDVVECGVGRGASFFLIGRFMSAVGHQGRLFGYDSFEGFPEPSAYDASARNVRVGEWSDTSPEHVRGHFVEAGLASFFDERCQLVRGFFDRTLTGKLPFNAIALLHLDVDLYESYRTSGMILEPLVAGTGVILFDEYNQPVWPGATKAVTEILAGTRRILLYSRLMDKYIALDSAHWSSPSAALLELRSQLQLEPFTIPEASTL